MATCYRHPGRETGVSCSNCGRPICPDCMTPTPVGMRCPECASQKTRVIRGAAAVNRTPRVTVTLIAINVLVFLFEGPTAFTFGGSAGGTLIEKGALIGSFPTLPGIGVAHGQWWRIVTCGFLHENFLHIGFNMWVLYVFGTMLEPAIGSLKFAVVYFVSLLASSFVALITTPHGITVGASGAIFGVMGAVVVVLYERRIPIMQSGVGWVIALNLIFSFTLPGISWGGHLGGLAGGLLTMAALQFGDRLRSPAIGYGISILIAVVCFAGAVEVAHRNLENGPVFVPGGPVR
ncbi:MAG TPA: rhomboid family intramembrane serine protease [Solirubrobacteraceae bacterium]|nr:rhomboid family intramembrane serine protease [Solirubrobacteraceae bacterium]